MKLQSGILKCLCLISVSIFLFSCNKKPASEAKVQNDTSAFHFNDTIAAPQENPKIVEYKTFLLQLDSTDVASATKAMEKYKEIFAEQSQQLADSGFILFQAMYDVLESQLNEKHMNDTTNFDPLLNGDPTQIPPKIKSYQKKLELNGFKISQEEGTTYVEQDRRFVAKNFYTFLTPTMKTYLSELQKENSEGFVSDGGIVISYKQLVERTIWYEKFMNENPNFILNSNCKNYKRAYLSYLMMGIDNTPLYDDEAQTILSEYYVSAFQYLLKKYPNSETTTLIKPYYEALKQKQAAKAKAILKDYVVKGLILYLN